jgi:hypothetical protein
MRARGGTRTAFQPLQTLGSPGNMGNPARSDLCTTQSGAQSVDIVHTPISPLQSFQTNDRTQQRRGAVLLCADQEWSAGSVHRVYKRASLEGMTGWLRACGARGFQSLHGDSNSLQPFHGLIGPRSHDRRRSQRISNRGFRRSGGRASKGRMIEIHHSNASSIPCDPYVIELPDPPKHRRYPRT